MISSFPKLLLKKKDKRLGDNYFKKNICVKLSSYFVMAVKLFILKSNKNTHFVLYIAMENTANE